MEPHGTADTSSSTLCWNHSSSTAATPLPELKMTSTKSRRTSPAEPVRERSLVSHPAADSVSSARSTFARGARRCRSPSVARDPRVALERVGAADEELDAGLVQPALART